MGRFGSQLTNAFGVTGIDCRPHRLHVQEPVRLSDLPPSDGDDGERDDPPQEHRTPPVRRGQQIDPGGEEDAKGITALDDGVQQPSPAGGDLFVHQRDGDGQFSLREARRQRTDQGELPVVLDEERQTGEDRRHGEAEHPHPLAAPLVHSVADEQRDDELCCEDDEAEQSDRTVGQSEITLDVGQGKHQQVGVVAGQRPAGNRHDDQVGDVAPVGRLLGRCRVGRIQGHGALLVAGRDVVLRFSPDSYFL